MGVFCVSDTFHLYSDNLYRALCTLHFTTNEWYKCIIFIRKKTFNLMDSQRVLLTWGIF